MKNTRKHLICLMLGLLVPILFAVFYLCGCEKVEKNYYTIPGGYETVDGEYRVAVIEVEDTCSPEEELAETWWDTFSVVVQEKRDDGGYFVDMSIDALWFGGVKVAEDGSFHYEYHDEWWQENYLLNGTLTPEEVDATLTLQALDWDGGVYCYATYEMRGYKLYVNAPPPDDMER